MKELLKKLGACEEAVHWAGNKSIEEIVKECHRGDWLLWLAIEIEIDVKSLTLAKGHCANTVRHLMKDQRSIKAVDTAIAFGEGMATLDELEDAASVAKSAYASAASYNTYAYYAAYASAASYNTSAASADAAFLSATAYYASAAAKKENQMQTANICRTYLGKLIIDKCNELNNKK